MRRVWIGVMIIGMLCCGAASGEENEVLARIGKKEITSADLRRIIGYYDPEKQKLLELNEQNRAALLKRIVQGIVLSGVARDAGFDRRPEIKEQIELLVNDFLATEYLKREVIGKITVTDDDMNLYYKAHKDEFRTPEMVRVRQILVKVDKSAPDETRGKARERAEEILKRIKNGEDFSKLASEVSDDLNSKQKGGDIGFFPRGKMVPEFEEVAFSLAPGEVSGIIETPLGFHIIKVEEKRESAAEAFDKVKDKVREKVFAEFRKARVDEYLDKVMNDAGAQVYQAPRSQPKGE